MTPFQGAVITVNFVLLGPMWCGIASLCLMQHGLVFQNNTSIEQHIRRYAYYEAKKEGRKYLWPYDLGPPQNVLQFFGTDRHRWYFPVAPRSLLDGIHFPTVPSEFPISKGSDSNVLTQTGPSSDTEYATDDEESHYYHGDDEIIDI
jgi:hypothetical protein